MGAIHDRWELVEPLLFAHPLRDPSAFLAGKTRCSSLQVLEAIRSAHRIDEAAIAQALNALGDPELEKQNPLHVVIRRESARWLVANGDHWALRMENRRPGHEIIRWRGLTMLVPPSIIIAGALSQNEHSHPCRVQVLPDSIAPREPVGHLHVHLGPMLPFEALWSQLWYAFLLRGSLDTRTGQGIASMKNVPDIGRHASKRQPGMRWQWLLELAFAARVWLKEDKEDTPPIPSAVLAFSRGQIDLERRAGALLALWSHGQWRARARLEVHRLSDARRNSDRCIRRKRAAAEKAPVDNTDIAVSQLHDADEEILFLTKALRRCPKNETYARVFYQYLRVKVALYGHLVVDPWTIGLRHFLDVVQRDGPYSKVIDDDIRLEDMRLGAASMEIPLQVEALEIHIPPARWLNKPRRTPHEHRWVLSFVRAKAPKTDDPTGAAAANQWRRKTAEIATQCRLLARCMVMRPSVLRELRGLSLMDWERNGPVWLFATSFRRLIDASAEVAAGHPRLSLRPIQTAFHLGEDFDHLLTGLRQIFEPFEWGLIRRGDRLGHALALGLSPEAWCSRNPWVRMRPWDRILDIGFVYWALDTLRLRIDGDHVERMRLNAGDAIHRIFEDHQGRDPLETARNIWLSLPGQPLSGVKRSWEQAERLVHGRPLVARILDEQPTGRRALSLSLTTETRLELPLLKAVHDAVHDRVVKAQVAIEVNPSSNLLVGGFRSIFEQPVFHSNDIPITLNADDPLTFATTLADDYAYAWAGMVIGAGQSPDQATRRLEEAARCSMRYVFDR